jgi:hypothetical protein
VEPKFNINRDLILDIPKKLKTIPIAPAKLFIVFGVVT